mmetsp:Transcript_59344/g.190944  ORF Transcript_59344/g.190944 Transcript_59344/m.190944 type:complete len:158 (+) Transcript_59344:1692-2165(+)
MFPPHVPLEGIVEEVKGEVQKMERAEAARRRVAAMERLSARDKGASDTEAWRKWLRQYGARVVRCQLAAGPEARREAMRRANPEFVLRNWVAQEAIEAAEKGDYSPVRALLQRLEDPFGSGGADAGPQPGGEWLGKVLACQSDGYSPPARAASFYNT